MILSTLSGVIWRTCKNVIFGICNEKKNCSEIPESRNSILKFPSYWPYIYLAMNKTPRHKKFNIFMGICNILPQNGGWRGSRAVCSSCKIHLIWVFKEREESAKGNNTGFFSRDVCLPSQKTCY